MENVKFKSLIINESIQNLTAAACLISIDSPEIGFQSKGWSALPEEALKLLSIGADGIGVILSEIIKISSKFSIGNSKLIYFPLNDGRKIRCIMHKIDNVIVLAIFENVRENSPIFDTTGLPVVFTVDGNGHIVAMNQTAQTALIGSDFEMPVAFSLAGLLGKEFEKKFYQVLNHPKARKHTFSFSSLDESVYDAEIMNSDGNERITVIIYTTRNELEKRYIEEKRKGELTEELNSVLQLEIFEHKATQLELETSKNYVQSILDCSLDMIITLDINRIVKEFNRRAEQVLGYKKTDILGKHISTLIINEEHIDNLTHAVIRNGSFKEESVMQKKNGEPCDVLISASLLRDDVSEIDGYVLIVSDITESQEASRKAREQQAKIEGIFESGSIMFWTVNKNIALTSFNREYSETVKKLYGHYPELNPDLSKEKKKFAPDHYHEFWEKKYKEVFSTGKRIFFQTKTTDKKGENSYREIYLNPIWDTDGNRIVKEVAGMALDITDKKQAERKLNEQAAKIKTIFDATNHMIWSVDLAYNITSFNEGYKKWMQERFGIKSSVGQSSLDIAEKQKKGHSADLLKLYKLVESGEKVLREILYVDRNQKEHIEEVSLNPIYDEEDKLVEIACMSQTVTYKRTAERKLKDQAAKINAIFESTALVIWTLDPSMRVVSLNKVFSNEYFKLTGKELGIGVNLMEALKERLSEKGSLDLKNHITEALNGQPQQFEGAIYTKDGNKRWMEVFLNPINEETGSVKEVSCICFEITEKKEIEEQMRSSIQEKEILLQEVHHRVKNNLQVISSILNLQSSYVRDKNSLNILRESQNRIKSMSFIHESLYQTKDFSRIEFSDYILSLTNNLIHSYSLETSKIKLITDFKKVFLSLDQAIPCGLIANELVSNALKYAFPFGNEGIIEIRIAEEGKNISLMIGDNGVGLPEEFKPEDTESLGLQLVYTLVDQLDASIQVQSEGGTKYLITFEKR